MGCVLAPAQTSAEEPSTPSSYCGTGSTDSVRFAFLLAEIRGDRFDIRSLAQSYSQLDNSSPVGHPAIGEAFLFACKTGDAFGCASIAIRSRTPWLSGLLESCHLEQVPVPLDSLASMVVRIPSNERILPTGEYNPERALFIAAAMALAQNDNDLARQAIHKALGVRPNSALARNASLLAELTALSPLIAEERKQGCPSPRFFAINTEGLAPDYQETWRSNHGWLIYDPYRNTAIGEDIPLLSESFDLEPSRCDLVSLRRRIGRLPKAKLAVNFRSSFDDSSDEPPAFTSLAVALDESSRAAYCEIADTKGAISRARIVNARNIQNLVEEYRKSLGPLTDSFQDYLFQS